MKLSSIPCGFFLNLVILGKGQILPEPLIPHNNHTTVCYGPGTHMQQFRPSCPDNSSVIAVQHVRVGAKPIDTGCPSSITEWTNHTGSYLVDHADPSKIVDVYECCYPDVENDCIFDYNYLDSGIEYRYHRSSSGYSTSQTNLEVAWEKTTCNDSSKYLTGTNFMYMDYSCIERTKIGDLCSNNNYTAMNGAFYLYNTDYPRRMSAAIEFCQCRVRSNASTISFYSIDVRLEKYEENCKQTLNITDSNGTTIWDCHSNPVFNVTKQTKSKSLTIVFKNHMPIDGGYVWIGVSAEAAGALTIDCTYKLDIEESQTVSPSTNIKYTKGTTVTDKALLTTSSQRNESYRSSVSSAGMTTSETPSSNSRHSRVSTMNLTTSAPVNVSDTSSLVSRLSTSTSSSASTSSLSTSRSSSASTSSLSTSRLSSTGTSSLSTSGSSSAGTSSLTTSSSSSAGTSSLSTSRSSSAGISSLSTSRITNTGIHSEASSPVYLSTISKIQTTASKQSHLTGQVLSQTTPSQMTEMTSKDNQPVIDNQTLTTEVGTVSESQTITEMYDSALFSTQEMYIIKATGQKVMIGIVCGIVVLAVILIPVICVVRCLWNKIGKIENRVNPGEAYMLSEMENGNLVLQDQLHPEMTMQRGLENGNLVSQYSSQTENTNTEATSSSSYVCVRNETRNTNTNEESEITAPFSDDTNIAYPSTSYITIKETRKESRNENVAHTSSSDTAATDPSLNEQCAEDRSAKKYAPTGMDADKRRQMSHKRKRNIVACSEEIGVNNEDEEDRHANKNARLEVKSRVRRRRSKRKKRKKLGRKKRNEKVLYGPFVNVSVVKNMQLFH